MTRALEDEADPDIRLTVTVGARARNFAMPMTRS
jgi:hypothetical protein